MFKETLFVTIVVFLDRWENIYTTSLKSQHLSNISIFRGRLYIAPLFVRNLCFISIFSTQKTRFHIKKLMYGAWINPVCFRWNKERTCFLCKKKYCKNLRQQFFIPGRRSIRTVPVSTSIRLFAVAWPIDIIHKQRILLWFDPGSFDVISSC